MILKNHIRPPLVRLGVDKKIGWHSFRHGIADLRRWKRVDIKTAQDLMRHANPQILLNMYQQTVTEERREAQALAFDSIWANNTFRTHVVRLRKVGRVIN